MLGVLLARDIAQHAVRLLEVALFVAADAPVVGNDQEGAILAAHLVFTMQLTCALVDREILFELRTESGRKKVREIAPVDLLPFVSEGVEPGLVDLEDATFPIQ